MNDTKHRVCPVERAGHLDSGFRKWFQHPQKILRPYIREGMTVLDFGCGPGFFSIALAQLVGPSGQVIASDLQEGMLQKLRDKIIGTELEKRFHIDKCQKTRIGWPGKIDFALAFYVLHEVPDQEAFFRELASMLNPNGQILVVEPRFHVSTAAFRKTVRIAQKVGFTPEAGPKVFFSKTVILKGG